MRSIKFLATAYLVLLHLLVIYLIAKSEFVAGLLTFSVARSPEDSHYVVESVAHHRRMDASIPDGAVIFIGDSITEGLATSAVVSNSVNFGIGTNTTAGVLNNVPFYQSLERANAIVLAIGVNDLPLRTNNEIKANLKSIIDVMPADVPLLISGILPVDQRQFDLKDANRRRMAINQYLDTLVVHYSSAIFIDHDEELLDAEGQLGKEFHDGDGLHLNTRGYAILIRRLRFALNEHLSLH